MTRSGRSRGKGRCFQSLRAFVWAAKRDQRHRVAQHAGSDRVALGMLGIQEAFRRCLVDHLGQLPAQIHRILHAGVEALSTVRGMHVCGVAGQQDPSSAPMLEYPDQSTASLRYQF